MATPSFTQSLFGGIDPYKIQRENMQQLFAPIQQAKDPYSKIGAALGTLGGMALFGMPKDPRLAKVTEVQQTVQQVMGEAPDEATFAERLPLLQQAFTEKGLIDQAAIVAERIKALTPKSPFSSIDQSKFTPESIKKFITAGAKDSDRVLLDPIEKKDSIKPTPTFQQAAGGLGIPLQPTLDLYTPDQIRKVNDALKENDMEKARASAARLEARLNFDSPSDRVKAVSEINSNLKPYAEPLVETIKSIQLGLSKTSPFAQKGFETAVGGVFGGLQRAQAEIERLRNSGNLGERLTNTLSLFLSGNIGEATRDDQMEVLMSLYELNRNQYDNFVEPYRAAVGDKADAIAPFAQDRFKLPKLQPGRQYIPMSVVVANELKKGESFESGGQTYVYNGDGTISPVKGQ
jgi:hypothetical protein